MSKILNKIKRIWKIFLRKEDDEEDGGVLPIYMGIDLKNDENRFVPNAILGPNLDYIRLLDFDGKDVDHSKYYKMIVDGYALTPFGVGNGNLLLSEKCNNPEEIEFPKICIFRKEPKGKDNSRFLAGKVWKRGLDIREVLRHPDFQIILNTSKFNGLEDNDNIPEDPVIISWLGSEGWTLRYMSLKDIIGIAKYSYEIGR